MSVQLPASTLSTATDRYSLRSVPAGHGLQWLVAGWRLFLKAPGVWLGITFVLLLLALIPIMLGLLVLIPVLTGSVFASYGDIYGRAPSSALSPAASV